jgi:DNA replication regulator DPB11
MDVSKGNPRHGGSKSEIAVPISKSDSSLSGPAAKLGESRLDRTTFTTSESTTDKPKNLHTDASNSTPCLSPSAEPLSEINNNTCASAVSTAPAPPNHPAPAPQADINNAISNLLAKAKTSAKPPDETETGEGRRRGTNRILGRAASNISTTSTSLSRASSVDSTATHGQPVKYPPYSNASGRTEISESASEQVRRFANASNDRNVENTESPPPATQLQYDDPESKEYQEMAMAKMKGEEFDRGDGRKARVKERSITLGDVAEAARRPGHKSRPKRDKAALGFR